MDTLPFLTAVAVAFLLAGAVKGVIGLGLPTVGIGLLVLVMTPAQAAAVLIVPSLVTNVWQAFAGGGVLALVRRMWPLLTGICIGTFIGAVLLPNGASSAATSWLGVALVIFALLGLFKVHFSVPRRMETWLGLIVGFLTGAITVATGVFALPGVPYITALQLERDKLVQGLGLSFTVSTITLAIALSHAGEMRMSIAAASAVALVAALLGMVIGQFVRGKVQPATFRVFFFLGLLALGVHLALHGLL